MPEVHQLVERYERQQKERRIPTVLLPLAAAVTIAVVWRPRAAPPLDLANLTSGRGTAERAANLTPVSGDHEWSSDLRKALTELVTSGVEIR